MNFLTCKDVSKLASQALDRELTWGEWTGMKLHLLVCQACRRFTRHVRFLRRASRGIGEDLPGKATLGNEAKERIKGELGVRSKE